MTPVSTGRRNVDVHTSGIRGCGGRGMGERGGSDLHTPAADAEGRKAPLVWAFEMGRSQLSKPSTGFNWYTMVGLYGIYMVNKWIYQYIN